MATNPSAFSDVITVGSRKPPPPRTSPPTTSSDQKGVDFQTMTINGVKGGAALIGITLGSGKGKEPNLQVVIKASSRARLREVLQDAVNELGEGRGSDRTPVYLLLSLQDLMQGPSASRPRARKTTLAGKKAPPPKA